MTKLERSLLPKYDKYMFGCLPKPDKCFLSHGSELVLDSIILCLIRNKQNEDNSDIIKYIVGYPYPRNNLFKKLCELHYIDINMEDNVLLNIAIANNNTTIVRFLIENGIDPIIDNNILINDVTLNLPIEIMKLFINFETDIHAYNDYAIKHIVSIADYEKTIYLLDLGANLSVINTAHLMECCYRRNISEKYLKLLIDHNIDLTKFDSACLVAIISLNKANLIELLVDYGFDVGIINGMNVTHEPMKKIVDTLLQNGAEPLSIISIISNINSDLIKHYSDSYYD